MPKKRVTLNALTTTAVELADTDGFDALALTGVAEKLGVAASTLYTHADGVDGLKYLVAVAATRNLTETVRNAAIGASGPDALTAMGFAYREFALDHPGQFASTLLPAKLEGDELATAKLTLLGVFVLVYQAIGHSEHEARLAARATCSAIHGFLALEHTNTPSSDHDADYRFLLNALQHGLLHTHAASQT
ncbi:MAG: TetR/AcrR family transcriptional regulator [Acidimicrobiia bacterium]|nr:TetR/AcrR family transcriptional regulator [Acidimicrobiia bacterium]